MARSIVDEYNKALEPFFEMLLEKETTLSREEWVALVNYTRERIITAPEQYLRGVFKPSEEFTKTIETIFETRLN